VGFVALIGVALTVVPSMILFRIIATRRGGVRTQGTVIDNRRSVDYEGRSSYAQVMRFTTPHGRTVEFVSRMSTPVSYKIGKQVAVVYQPITEQAVLDTALGTWLIPTVILAVGIVLLLVGLIGFLIDVGVLTASSG